MARGRMLNRTVALHQGVAALGDDPTLGAWAVVLHHRIIAFLDGNGNVRADGFWLKGEIFPRVAAVTPTDCERFATGLVTHGLAIAYDIAGMAYLHFPGFRANQVGLRPDRESALDFCPLPSGWDAEARTVTDAIRQSSGSLPDNIRQSSGKNPHEVEVESEVEVEVELEKEGLPARGRAERTDLEAMPAEEFIDRVIRLANRGMADNPAVASPRPIEVGHGDSRQQVHDWLAAGVPRDTIERTVHSVAREYKPGTRAQISTLRYFKDAVREAWEAQQALNIEAPDDSGDTPATSRGRRGRGAERPPGSAPARGGGPAPDRYAHLVRRS